MSWKGNLFFFFSLTMQFSHMLLKRSRCRRAVAGEDLLSSGTQVGICGPIKRSMMKGRAGETCSGVARGSVGLESSSKSGNLRAR